MEKKPRLVIDPASTVDPTVGRWLTTMKDCRRRTKDELKGLPQSTLDFQAEGYLNSIGTLLYHIAAIEASWLYEEILEVESPPAVYLELFPHDVRTEEGRLTPVVGVDLNAHLERLDRVRGILIESLEPMSLEEFRRPRDLPDYLVAPEYVLHHLMQHEAEHRGAIVVLREVAESLSA